VYTLPDKGTIGMNDAVMIKSRIKKKTFMSRLHNAWNLRVL